MRAPPRPKSASAVPRIGSAIPSTALKQEQISGLLPSQINKGRVDFKVDNFTRIILQKGYQFVWRKALLCPCTSPATDQARVDCQVCDSSGYIYIEPITVQGIMTNLEMKKGIYRNLGEWLEGTSVVTTTPEIRLGYRDSLAMVHSLMTFNEWITKGNRRGVRTRLPLGHDVCRYRVVNMLHLMYEVDKTTGKVSTEKVNPDNLRPKAAELGVDFEITKDGWIKWLFRGNERIPDGTVLTVHYEFHPVWIVITNPHGVRDTVTRLKEPLPTAKALPLQVAVKLDYLIESKVLPSSAVTEAFGSD